MDDANDNDNNDDEDDQSYDTSKLQDQSYDTSNNGYFRIKVMTLVNFTSDIYHTGIDGEMGMMIS